MLQPVHTSPPNYKLEHLDSPKTALPHADPHASDYFLEAPVDSSPDGSTETLEDMGIGSTIVPETPYNDQEGSTETTSSPTSPYRHYDTSFEL